MSPKAAAGAPSGEEVRRAARETPPCDACDRCLEVASEGTIAEAETPDAGPFALNDRVRHTTHGIGLVARVEDGRVVVAFEDAGYKTLDVATTPENGLLRREAS